MLDSRQADSVAVHAGGMPLSGRVEVRDLRDAAQVAGAVGIAAGVAGPVVVPELLRTSVPEDVIVIHWDVVSEPVLLPTAVDAHKRQEIAGDQAQEVIEQRGWQPFPRWQVGPVIGDDGRQRAQVALTGRYRSRHHAFFPPARSTLLPPAALAYAERHMAASSWPCTHWQVTHDVARDRWGARATSAMATAAAACPRRAWSRRFWQPGQEGAPAGPRLVAITVAPGRCSPVRRLLSGGNDGACPGRPAW
jgi:hypothetical protein